MWLAGAVTTTGAMFDPAPGAGPHHATTNMF